MQRRHVIGSATTPDGGSFELVRQGSSLAIFCDGSVLMSSELSGSEEAMAAEVEAHLARRSRPRVLVGGLGLGYTLRAVLDATSARTEVVCVELMKVLAEWHRGPLGPLAGRPLEDPRVTLVCDDVVRVIQRSTDAYDAILLDVDNGPIAMTVRGNWRLYSPEGLRDIHRALRPDGVLVVWSASADKPFAKRMRQAGFDAQMRRVGARTGSRPTKGETHVLLVGRRTDRPPRRHAR